jgi:acyl carrier protein
LDDLETELKNLIVDVLKLEDISAADISSEEPLFIDGLGLDSIDALELGVVLRKRYGIRIESVTDEVKAHFACVRSLAQFIRMQQGARADDAVEG